MNDLLFFNISLLLFTLTMAGVTRSYRQNSWVRFAWLAAPLVAAIPILLPQSTRGVMPIVTLPEVELLGGASAEVNTSWSLTYLWLAGSLVALGISLFRLTRLMMIKSRASLAESHFQLSEKDNKAGAFSFFSWIFLPSGLSAEMRHCILRHEAVHVRRVHSADMLLTELLSIVFWFNPGVYLMKKGLRVCHENEADMATSNQVGSETYVNALLSSAFGMREIMPIVHPFSDGNIKTRIHMLHNSKTPRFAWVLPLFMGLTFLSFQACTKTAEKTDSPSTVAQVADRQAEFNGGMEGLVNYIVENLQYPETAKAGEISGTTFIQFVIDEEGKVTNVEVAKSLSPECDAAAVEVVRNMPNWTPAMQGGAPVSQQLTLPVKFALE